MSANCFGGSLFTGQVLIDTSAAIAICNQRDQFHQEAMAFFTESRDRFHWFTLSITVHETYTRSRYHWGYQSALECLGFLRGEPFSRLDFNKLDEDEADRILETYDDQRLSYHDALCAAVMTRQGIAGVFSFDRDFSIMGFSLLPGTHSS